MSARITMHRLWLTLFLPLVASAALAADYKEGDVEVKFEPTAHLARFTVPAMLHARLSSEHNASNWFTLKLPAGLSTRTAVNRLKTVHGVKCAEPNFIRRPFFTPNDVDYGQQYAPQKISCPSAWNYTLGASRITIAFIDTGIDTLHPEFAGRIKVFNGCNIVDGNSDPTDNDGHGTHCAGIAAAGTNNNIGIAGICQASIMPIKVFDGNNGGTVNMVSKAYEFAANNGADIISASLGGTDPSQEELDAVTYALSRGVIFVAAAGNDGSTVKQYPGAYTGVISVGASDAGDHQTSYTEYGDWVTVAAPGDNVLSTWIGEGYALDSGTSMATPCVAGALALLKSYAPIGTDPSAIRDALLSTTDSIGSWTHYGRINVGAAMTLLAIETTGSVTIFPTGENRFEGTVTGGSLSSLLALDHNTLQILTETPTAGIQVGSAELEFLVSTTAPTIKASTFNFAAFGATNGLTYLWLYNNLRSRWDAVGSVTMSATDDSIHQITMPANLAPYLHNGKLLAVVRGYLSAASNGGQDPQFTYQIDLTSITLSITNGP